MKKTNLLKSMLLLCALVAGSGSVWAAPGDEIKSPTNVVSGKWYYLKGIYSYSKIEYTVYYGPTVDTKNTKIGESSTPSAVTEISSAMPVLFTYDSTEKKWTLQTPNGNYIRPHSSNGQSYLEENAYYLTLSTGNTKEGTGNGIKIGTYVSGTKTYYLQVANNAAKIGGYQNTGYDLTLIEAPCPTISSVGWTTFSCTYALDFTGYSDANAYMVTSASGTTLTLSQVTGTVPAETPLLISGTADATVNIPVTASSSTDVSANKLKKGTGASVNAADKYVLVARDSKAVFAPTGDHEATVPVGKAYLDLNGVTLAPEFVLDDSETTGIESVNSEVKGFFDGEFYNLSGQRVTKPTKGLYIVNGKKVIIK